MDLISIVSKIFIINIDAMATKKEKRPRLRTCVYSKSSKPAIPHTASVYDNTIRIKN